MQLINWIVISIPLTTIKPLSVHMVIVASEAGKDTVNMCVVEGGHSKMGGLCYTVALCTCLRVCIWVCWSSFSLPAVLSL